MAYGIDQEIQRKVDAYRANPQQLAQRYQQNQQLVDLLALQKLKTEKEQAANDIRAKMQQSPQTVAQQREQEVQQLTKNELAQQTQGIMQNRQRQQQKNLQRVAQGGLGSIAPPKQMASGGVVAFQGGGGVTEERVLAVLREQGLPDTPENRAGVRGFLERGAEYDRPENRANRMVDAVLEDSGMPDTPENRRQITYDLMRERFPDQYPQEKQAPAPRRGLTPEELAAEPPSEAVPAEAAPTERLGLGSAFGSVFGPGGVGVRGLLQAADRADWKEGAYEDIESLRQAAAPPPVTDETRYRPPFIGRGLEALKSAATPSAPAAPKTPSGPPRGIESIAGLGDTTPVPGTDLSGLSPAITEGAAAPVPARPGRADLETVLRPEQQDMYKGLEGVQGISAEDLPTSLPDEMMQDYDELFGATREMASQDGLSQYDVLSQKTEQVMDRENIQKAYDRLAKKSEESGLTPLESSRLKLMANVAGGFGTPRGVANMYREQVRQLNAEQAQLDRTLGIEEAAIDTSKAINTAMADAGLEGFKQASADRRTGLQGMVGLFDARLQAVSSLRADELSRLQQNMDLEFKKEKAKVDAAIAQNEALMSNKSELLKMINDVRTRLSDRASLVSEMYMPEFQRILKKTAGAKNEKQLSKAKDSIANVQSMVTTLMALDEGVAQDTILLQSLQDALSSLGGDEFVSARPANP